MTAMLSLKKKKKKKHGVNGKRGGGTLCSTRKEEKRGFGKNDRKRFVHFFLICGENRG